MARRLCIGLTAIVLGLLGCGECEDDYDCPGQAVCTDAVCARVVCTRNTACPPAQRCQANACVPQTPEAPQSAAPVTVILERDG